mgnify:CR=1 FL=1
MEKLISIIVPVYNAERTLHRCVTSLVEQSYPNIEILLVNDGSKDASLEMCRGYEQQDSRIRVIDKPNGGVSSARNAGLDVARGEYIMFCDSDDWVSPLWCEHMVRNHIPQNLTVCEIAWGGPDAEAKDQQLSEEIIVERNRFLQFSFVMCPPWNKLFERNAIQKSDLRFSGDLRLGEDLIFVMEYLCNVQGQVRILPQRLYYYDTSTEGSLSKRSATMEQCDLFYHRLTAAMETLKATDEKCVYNRDWHVMTQFENMLITTAENKGMSFWEKMKLAAAIEKMDSFYSCSGQVIQWGNWIYTGLFQRKSAKGIMLYLILRAAMAEKRS